MLDAKAKLGEGPAWDDRCQRLVWVDIDGETVHRFDPATGADEQWPVGMMVGAAVPISETTEALLLATTHGFQRLDLTNGSLTALADPEADRPGNRFNDGKVDPEGRFWAGTLVMKGERNTAALYSLGVDGGVVLHQRGIQISNGLAWNAEGDLLYYIDTPTYRIDRFRYDAASGTVRARETAFTVPENGGGPDGMCIDDDDHLWVAHWGGHCVRCYDPADGSVLHEIKVAAPKVTSCCFGGPDFRTLYITTARKEDGEAHPHAGGVFAVELPVSGPATRYYGGRVNAPV